MNILPETKHEQRLELYKQGLTDAEIAQKVGVHPITIYEWRRKQGIPPNRKKKPVTRPKIVDEPIIWYSPQEFLRRWEGGFEYQYQGMGKRRGGSK